MNFKCNGCIRNLRVVFSCFFGRFGNRASGDPAVEAGVLLHDVARLALIGRGQRGGWGVALDKAHGRAVGWSGKHTCEVHVILCCAILDLLATAARVIGELEVLFVEIVRVLVPFPMLGFGLLNRKQEYRVFGSDLIIHPSSLLLPS